MNNSLLGRLGVWLLLLAAGTQTAPCSSAGPASRRAVVTFAFFGCNRIDGADWDANRMGNPSSANVPQLRQNLADIALLAPDLLFFGGDLVMGYADDRGETLRSQMGAWFDLVTPLPRAEKTRCVVIAGNHELNRKAGEKKLPSPAMDPIWSEMALATGYVPNDSKGPTPTTSPDDRLVSDQRALTFSFNRGPVHFVVLNTDTRVSTIDPKTGETKIAMIPVRWLEADLDAAERDKRIRAVVVLGHRNLVEPASVHGDAPIDPVCAARMTHILAAHSKVRAYVCAHVHAFDVTVIGGAGVRQVVFGNGGSRLEEGWKPERGRTFGFGLFRVYADGSLGIVPYLRPAPADYLANGPADVPPASAEAEIVILPRESSR